MSNYDFNSKELKINGIPFILTERSVSQVRAFDEMLSGENISLEAMALAVAIGLRKTKNMAWKAPKHIRAIAYLNPKRLIKKIGQQQLVDLYMELLVLEGAKLEKIDGAWTEKKNKKEVQSE